MIIVTGGAGFIGSALIWGLNQKGQDNILVVDQFESAHKWKNLVKRKFRSFISIDTLFPWLEDSKNLESVEAVFHMGACSSTTEKNMDYLLKNNTDYTVQLFKICQRQKIPFIYASSAATYGDGSSGFSDAHEEIENLHPINPYGYSKQLADLWILREGQKTSFWCGLKFFNVYGPNEYHKEEMRSLVDKAFPSVQSEGLMRLFKSYKEDFAHGEQKRDFIYIKDVVDIMLHIWSEHKSSPSGIYNVGTGKSRTFLDLGKALFTALELNPKFEFISMPESIRDQYQYFTEAKMEKLRQNFKYKKEMTSLEEGISDYVKNYLDSEDPYL